MVIKEILSNILKYFEERKKINKYKKAFITELNKLQCSIRLDKEDIQEIWLIAMEHYAELGLEILNVRPDYCAKRAFKIWYTN